MRSDQSIVLLLQSVSKSFGGVDAARNVNLAVREGEIHALIGPNGAGKTTLFNLITGEIQAEKGRIKLFGTDVNHSSIQLRSVLGLGRTYQLSNLFLKLSVRENFFLASWGKRSKKLTPMFRSWMRDTVTCKRVREVAGMVGLKNRLEILAEELSHGEQRHLEIGMAIACNPRILLLDEPMAGLSSTERARMTRLIGKHLSKRMTILLIEHDMSTVFNIASKITVMHEGSIIAEGDPEEIRSNRHVQQIYMVEARAKSNEGASFKGS